MGRRNHVHTDSFIKTEKILPYHRNLHKGKQLGSDNEDGVCGERRLISLEQKNRSWIGKGDKVGLGGWDQIVEQYK